MTATIERVDVGAVVGANALTPEDGGKIYTDLLQRLKSGVRVDLDFSKVEVFASPFFNASVSRLLADFPAEFLRDHLTFSGLSAAGDRVLRRSLENAKGFYGTDENGRTVISSAARDAASS